MSVSYTHLAGGKGLGDGEVGIQEFLFHFADLIIDIILMGRYAGMLLKQFGEMCLAEAGRLGRFVQVKRLLPVAFYVLFAPLNFFSPPVYFLKIKNGGKIFYCTISVNQRKTCNICIYGLYIPCLLYTSRCV